MKILCGLFFLLVCATAQAGTPDMIFWEHQVWDGCGIGQRLTLWADGRSEISVHGCNYRGPAEKLGSQWQMREKKPHNDYYKTDILPKEEAQARFKAALAAGIMELKTFEPGYNDGTGTLVGVEVDGKIEQKTIPMFLHDGKPDNKGSENETRFLAVKNAIGNFDAQLPKP